MGKSKLKQVGILFILIAFGAPFIFKLLNTDNLIVSELQDVLSGTCLIIGLAIFSIVALRERRTRSKKPSSK